MAGPPAGAVPEPRRPLSTDRLHPHDRAQWRAWLATHHGDRDEVWLVFWRKQSGRTGLTYDQAVEEALCFGWIDGKAAKLDDRRTMVRFTPRKRGSGWARTNKVRVERLLAEGLMAEAGLARIEEAKRDGSWTKLDAVEDLVVPDDLAAAFAGHPGSRERWDGFPRSVRRGVLEWIVQAKRPDTRARRVSETARRAAEGERPGPGAQPRP
jgi:uncharacterized protein YdeI (YjbR/CyaY-like superfamily)